MGTLAAPQGVGSALTTGGELPQGDPIEVLHSCLQERATLGYGDLLLMIEILHDPICTVLPELLGLWNMRSREIHIISRCILGYRALEVDPLLQVLGAMSRPLPARTQGAHFMA